MKNNKQNTRKVTRRTKEEKRRLAFEKRNVKKEKNLVHYGAEGGSALVMAKTADFNRRFIAAFLALVFAISCMLVGVNFATKADDPSAAPINPLMPEEKGRQTPNSEMVLNKFLTLNDDGNYDLTLEAYATAKVKPITEKIPTDFVVVVDQSGSMDTPDIPTGDPTVQNNKYLEDIANGQYYYKDGENYYRVYGVKDYLYRYYESNHWWTGSIMDHYGTDRSWFMGQSDATTNIANAFYFREVVNGVTYYQPINTTVEGKIGTYYLKFSYDSKEGVHKDFNRRDETYVTNGNAPWYHNLLNGNVMKSGALWWAADKAVRAVYWDDLAYTYSELATIRTGMYINYPMYDRHVAYTKLCYRDANGVIHEVPSNTQGRTTWEFCDADNHAIVSQTGARPTYSGLYQFPGTTDRLSALKEALQEFSQKVADETDSFGKVDNRISIVGFSSPGYNNTELLTHTDRDISNSSTDGWQKSTCDDNTSEYYGKGLVDSTNGTAGTVNPKITNAISAITANGGTQPEDGLNMAYQVLTNRSNTTYTIRSGQHKNETVDRNTVVIFFTDGQPGDYAYSDQYTEANEVVAQAKQIKDYGKTLDYGTSIFSIGVFGESDGNPLTYDGINDWITDPSHPNQRIQVKDLGDRRLWEFLGGWMETSYSNGAWHCLRRQWRPNSSDGYTAEPNDTIFDYMSVVSSNYPDAKNYIAPEWLTGGYTGNYIAATDGDDVRKKSAAENTNKYYRMASDQKTLVDAFLRAVTMNNEQSDPNPVPASSIELKDTISDSFSVKLDSQNNPKIEYYTQQGLMGTDGFGNFSETAPVEIDNPGGGFNKETKTLTVTGFDFSGEYIASDKTDDNAGRKLIVVIRNVTPNSDVTTQIDNNQNVIPLYSNKDGAGINVIDDDGYETTIGEFPKPYISRHSYKLDILGENKKAQFNVFTRLEKTDPNASDDLSGVIVVKADGTRINYSTNLVPPPIEEGQEAKPARIELGSMYYDDKGTEDRTDDIDRSTFYYENVPNGYKIVTEVEPIGDDFTYYAYYDTESSSQKSEFTSDNPLSKTDFSYANHVIHISSEANSRTVTIKETVGGSYYSDDDTFAPVLTLIPPSTSAYTDSTKVVTGSKAGTTESFTFNRDSTGNYILPIAPVGIGDENKLVLNIPYGWTLKVEQTDGGYYITTPTITYGDQATPAVPAGTAYPTSGKEILVNTDIVINNVADNITIEGVTDSNNHNWIIYILAAVAGLAAIGAGIFLWKKRNEFVEE